MQQARQFLVLHTVSPFCLSPFRVKKMFVIKISAPFPVSQTSKEKGMKNKVKCKKFNSMKPNASEFTKLSKQNFIEFLKQHTSGLECSFDMPTTNEAFFHSQYNRLKKERPRGRNVKQKRGCEYSNYEFTTTTDSFPCLPQKNFFPNIVIVDSFPKEAIFLSLWVAYHSKGKKRRRRSQDLRSQDCWVE